MSRFARPSPIAKSFVKISMCSYERVGWLGYRDLGFSNRDLSNWAGNVSHMNISAHSVTGIFFSQLRMPCKVGWHDFALSAFSVSLISIPCTCSNATTRIDKAMIYTLTVLKTTAKTVYDGPSTKLVQGRIKNRS